MIENGVQLTTSRLILRPPRSEDFEPLAAMMADPDTARFIGGPKSRVQAWQLFRAFGGGWHFDGFSCFSVFEKATNLWVGYAGIQKRDDSPVPESVAGIVRDRWRNGYVVEASTAVFDWAFEQLGFAEVISYVIPDHTVSNAIAKKMGAIFRGTRSLTLPVSGQDVHVGIWVFKKDLWLARFRNDSSDMFCAPRA